MKHTLQTLYCSQCGGSDIKAQAWVDPNTKEFHGYVNGLYFDEESCWCGNCQDHVELCTLKELWDRFSEVPINDDDEIEWDFLCFDTGASRFDVWQWFDERCPNGLAVDLMDAAPVDWDDEYTKLCHRFYLQNCNDGMSIPEAYADAVKRLLDVRVVKHTPVDRNELDKWYKKHHTNALLINVYDKSGCFDADSFRLCEHCGFPMMEGYCLGGELACSEECALALYDGDKEQMDEDLSHAAEDDGECYWTSWDSILLD